MSQEISDTIQWRIQVQLMMVQQVSYINNIVNNNQQQTTVQINGDLSFPNIKSGNDAELLLNDLSNMANKARQRSARR